MGECERIADQLARLWDGDSWYGPNLREVLRGVDAATAAARPLAGAHSMAEIVAHLTGWNREVLRRLESGIARDPEHGDWPAAAAGEDGWRAALAELEASFSELHAAIGAFPEHRLDEVLGEARDRALGSGVSFYVLLHGAVQHAVAHTAQLSLLKRGLSG